MEVGPSIADVVLEEAHVQEPIIVSLLVGVLESQIDRLSEAPPIPTAGIEPSQAVANVLRAAGKQMLARPVLATAMLQANNAAQLKGGNQYTEANAAFHQLLFSALGVSEPGDEDYRMVRLVEQTWYGVLISALNGVITRDEADEDVRLATRLLLGPRYDGGAA